MRFHECAELKAGVEFVGNSSGVVYRWNKEGGLQCLDPDVPEERWMNILVRRNLFEQTYKIRCNHPWSDVSWVVDNNQIKFNCRCGREVIPPSGNWLEAPVVEEFRRG